jgi:hypothetical protein
MQVFHTPYRGLRLLFLFHHRDWGIVRRFRSRDAKRARHTQPRPRDPRLEFDTGISIDRRSQGIQGTQRERERDITISTTTVHTRSPVAESEDRQERRRRGRRS